MILYISGATAYSIYNELFESGKIQSGYQMQKFNNNLITGLGKRETVVALSALPYANVKADKIDRTIDNVRYVGIKNHIGIIHKFSNPSYLYFEGARIIKQNRPRCIICDAIATSPCYISQALGKRYKIPVIGIITDLPGMLSKDGRNVQSAVSRMQNFDAYILLTEQMNVIVNPKNKPYMIMEGLCASNLPEIYKGQKKKVIMYTGSLWKQDAGIEYFVEGFLKANIPQYELHLYGTGELVPWIEQISSEHPQVKYKGCVSNAEIVRLQSEATLLVNPRPSVEEFCKYSFPSKTIEYMASGTPVLMTKLPGVPKEYYDYVYTIEEESVDGVCTSLSYVLSQGIDSLQIFGNRGRQFVVKKKGCDFQVARVLRFIGDTFVI